MGGLARGHQPRSTKNNLPNKSSTGCPLGGRLLGRWLFLVRAREEAPTTSPTGIEDPPFSQSITNPQGLVAVRVSDWENEWVTPTSVSFTWIYPRPHRPSL